MLSELPEEVLSLVAFHLCQPPTRPLPGPVLGDASRWIASPTNLLRTSRLINSVISPTANPELYARIFRANFDTAAVFRRLGDGPSTRKIRAREMTAELKRRVRALSRLREMMDRKEVQRIGEEEMWVIYVMLVENDGKNLEHLTAPAAPFQLYEFIDLYITQVMEPICLLSVMPPDGAPQALFTWILWLVLSHCPSAEHFSSRLSRLYVLRPYVFASHAYTIFLAPWTINDLPTNSAPDVAPMGNIFVADLKPRQTGVEVEWYGRRIKLSPPQLAQGAILNFFDRRCGNRSYRADDEDEDDDMEDDEDEEDSDAGSDLVVKRNILNSAIHDRDFIRLTKCHDPIHGAGMSRKSWRDSFNGVWEGNFSFFDFDAFKAMLAGQRKALYEGQYGEQRQVWRLVETYVRVKRARDVELEVKKEVKPKVEEEMYTFEEDEGEWQEEENDQAVEQEEEASPRNRTKLPLKGPSTNAGFPADSPPTTRAGLASAQAEEETLKETLVQQVEAIEGYEVVPEAELDAMLDNPDEESGLELLLTGTGHSAWGSFILRGRVRAWDGMASMVKEYSPDSRGKWIYRGYIVAGDTMVGRWRDTFTPEEYVGYEGAFILSRR
ncbi:uncharacterized protein MKK02DRAFT_44260 [Dioszegia hungarica]|uniref:F-box domain-containing protein n=1 Tax=Dioszegia hungarica TaxID=4972 RepID=A0AA38H8T9_9TREE|nr:uncharacterized protein MKK02DRAFT_44260 [Dioszegia hungarica]KAI9635571.1 hypothetical protein MKK02DRAFT_44260 [Dioszegia hungarica]